MSFPWNQRKIEFPSTNVFRSHQLPPGRRNLKTQASRVILDLCLTKTRSWNSILSWQHHFRKVLFRYVFFPLTKTKRRPAPFWRIPPVWRSFSNLKLCFRDGLFMHTVDLTVEISYVFNFHPRTAYAGKGPETEQSESFDYWSWKFTIGKYFKIASEFYCLWHFFLSLTSFGHLYHLVNRRAKSQKCN